MNSLYRSGDACFKKVIQILQVVRSKLIKVIKVIAEM